MRSVRALDPPGQFITACLIALFAIPPAALFIGMATQRSYWILLLSWAPFWIIQAFMRGPLSALGRTPRFVAWFCIGVTGGTFFALGTGRDFNLAIAAGFGLAIAIVDLIGTLWAERKAANG
jgi:hypothetical protein